MEPAQTLGPHVASLGITFYAEKPYSTGLMFPAQYNNTIFNAQHGSWDRVPPIGYRWGPPFHKQHKCAAARWCPLRPPAQLL